MKWNIILCKKVLSFALAASVLAVNVLPAQMSKVVCAAEETGSSEAAEITLQSVRDEAQASYESDQKLGFDIEFDEPFTGSGMDYSEDTTDRQYMQVFNNLKSGTDDQTVIIRFKTSNQNGLLFGAGTDTINNGKNMIVALNSGHLRVVFRNEGANSGWKGNYGDGLANDRYHTAAISFVPSIGLSKENVRIVIDGGEELYAKSVGGTANVGFNQNEADYTKFEIAGGTYAYADTCNSAAFNGEIDFLTVINKAYSVEQLQKITRGDKDFTNFSDMWESNTCKTWLFTGGTEGVADFATSRTTRNWIGLFEDSMRDYGSFVECGRFVFNTAKRGADIEQILREYDIRVSPFKTSVVGIMIGAADYRKGEAGIPEFKENLQAFLNKVLDENKKPLILTPYTALEETDQENVERYAAAINEVAGDHVKVIDLSSLDVSNLNEDGSLTPAGHQAVANLIKPAVGAKKQNSNDVRTHYTFDQLSDGSYTVAKQKDGEPAQLLEVKAGTDSITVKAEEGLADEETVTLEYTLTDTKGTVISGKVPAGKTEFTVSGLKKWEKYILNVYDVTRVNVKEWYQPVAVTVAEDEIGVPVEYEDEDRLVNEEIKDIFTGEEAATWLFMGDSITHGILTNGYDNVPQMFAKYLDEVGRTEDIVLNTGVTNATIATTMHQIDPRLKRYKPDVVMVMLGTNDTYDNGENVVAEDGTGQRKQIDAAEYKKRYKNLVEEIYQTNPDASIVLRVPCDMLGQWVGRHPDFEVAFEKIYEVASEKKAEHPELNITVVNHLKEWRNYRDNVRNDNLTTSGEYSWMKNPNNDDLHPNGRGNMAMFQQIIKEIGIYVPTSELANYQYNLDDWTGTSGITAPVVQKIGQKASSASFEMSALSGYTNGLKNVTLTLTDESGRSISKTAEYDAEGVIAISGLDVGQEYTATVTGKDAIDSKEITFAASLTKEEDASATETEQKEYTDSLAEAKNLDLTSYPTEIQEAYKAAIKEVEEQYVVGDMTVDQIDEALAAIRLARMNIQKSLQEITQARDDLKQALEDTKKTLDSGRQSRYKEEDWKLFTEKYSEAERAVLDDNITADELKQLSFDLKKAECMLLSSPTICPPMPKIEQNQTYVVDDYEYLVTDLAKRTVTITGTKNADLSKIVVEDDVKLRDRQYYKVTAIAAKAFANHKKVSSVSIGKNVGTIGDQAFAKCANLKKAVILSKGLTKIGSKAFLKDKKLRAIDIKSTALASVGKNAFKGTHAKLKITVPKAKYKAYLKKLKKKGQSSQAVIKKK